MKYLSIDIETTGLDPHDNQIIEFACVLDDTDKPIRQLHAYTKIVRPERIVGQPMALAMNQSILADLAQSARGAIVVDTARLVIDFEDWLQSVNPYSGHQKWTVAGKNFAMFDKDFLDEVGFRKSIPVHHRVIDPGSMYWVPDLDGTPLPDTKMCLARAGLTTDPEHSLLTPDLCKQHRALYDALNVVRLIRVKHGIPL